MPFRFQTHLSVVIVPIKMSCRKISRVVLSQTAFCECVVPNKTNTFILDLSIVSVNTSAEAELLIEVPDGVRRVAVFERRQPRLVAKQWTVGDKWARLAIGKATLNRWRHSNVTLRVRFGRSTVKSKAPYVVVSLLPVAASAGAKRFRRSSSHCNLVAQYVVLRELLHLKTFPEGTNFYYCSGHCSHCKSTLQSIYQPKQN